MELPLIAEDNFLSMFRLIEVSVKHADPEANMDIKRSSNGYMITITPAVSNFRQDTINNILYIGRNLNIPVKFSSSLAIQKSISFELVSAETLN